MRFLTLRQVLLVAEVILDKVEIRDLGLLESAVARPKTNLYGNYVYPDAYEQGAAFVDSIVNNHALIDGNKRLGLACLINFLGRNDLKLTCTQDEAVDFIILIASSTERDIKTLAKWIKANTSTY